MDLTAPDTSPALLGIKDPSSMSLVEFLQAFEGELSKSDHAAWIRREAYGLNTYKFVVKRSALASSALSNLMALHGCRWTKSGSFSNLRDHCNTQTALHMVLPRTSTISRANPVSSASAPQPPLPPVDGVRENLSKPVDSPPAAGQTSSPSISAGSRPNATPSKDAKVVPSATPLSPQDSAQSAETNVKKPITVSETIPPVTSNSGSSHSQSDTPDVIKSAATQAASEPATGQRPSEVSVPKASSSSTSTTMGTTSTDSSLTNGKSDKANENGRKVLSVTLDMQDDAYTVRFRVPPTSSRKADQELEQPASKKPRKYVFELET